MSLLKDVIGYGTHADRPAAGSAGRLYYETDTTTLFRDSGTAWVALPLGSGAPSLVKLDDVYLASAPASTFHFTTIDQSYNALRLVLRGTTTYTVDGGNPTRVFFDADTSSTNYAFSEIYSYGTAGSGGDGQLDITGAILGSLAGATAFHPLLQDLIILELPGYADTNVQKQALAHCAYHRGGDHGTTVTKIHWLDTRGITEILLSLDNGQFAQYSRATLYGIV